MQLYSLQQKDEYCLAGKLGLKNYGTSSFLNAIIQAISNIEPLCFILRELPYELVNYVGVSDSEEARLKRIELYYVLRKVLRELWKDKRIVIEPAVLIRRMNALNFLYDAITSQNLQETLSCLLEVINDTLLQQLPPQFEPQVNLRDSSPVWETSEPYQRSPIAEIFQGILEITSECTQCRTQVHSLEPFFTLNLSIVNLSKSTTELSKIHAAGVRREAENRSKKVDRTFTSGSNDGRESGWIVRSISRKETLDEEPAPKSLGKKLSRRFSISFDEEINSDDEISHAKAILPTHAEEKSVSGRENNQESSEEVISSKHSLADATPSLDTVFQHLQSTSTIPEPSPNDNTPLATPHIQKKASSEILPEKYPKVPAMLRQGNSAPRLSYFRERRHTSIRIIYDTSLPAVSISDEESPVGSQRPKTSMSARALNTYDYVKYSNKSWCQRTKDYCTHALYQLAAAVGMHLIGVGCHIHETLRDHFKTETKNSFCDACQQHTKTTYSKSLSAAPEVLCLNYKRFINLGFFNSKINALVDFPLESLDIGDYMTQASGYFRPAWKQYPIYDLTVLIYHRGESNAKDHYVVIAKHMPENIWFEYDDQRVREVTENYVKSREAMMLFYTKRSNTGPKADIELSTLRHSLLYHINKHKTEVEYAMNARKKKEEEQRKKKERMHQELIERQRASDGRVLRGRLHDSLSFRKLSTSIRRLSNGVNAFRRNSQSDKSLQGVMPPDNPPPATCEESSTPSPPSLPAVLPLVIESDESSSVRLSSPTRPQSSKINTPSNVVLEALQSTGNTDNEEVRDPAGLDSPRPEEVTKSSLSNVQRDTSPIDTHLTPMRMVRRTILKMTNTTKPVPVQPDKVIFTCDSNTTLMSTYWCMKFLSLADPGPLCNHDIVCCHGYLKPYLSECTSRIYTPVNDDLLREMSSYLNIKYGYPLWNDRDSRLVRTIQDLRMCAHCSRQHDDLMERRFDEAKGVSMAFLRDGNESSLSEEEQRQIQRDLQHDAKYYHITNDISTRNLVDNNTDATSRDDRDPILGNSTQGAAYCCIIFNKWVEVWKKFVRAGLVAEDIDFPVTPPGPICNQKLLDATGAVRVSLLMDVDYIAVSPGVWDYLHGIYGGGPAIFREDVDIYSEPVRVPSGTTLS